MQPAPVGANKPGGRPAAKLGADVGHRRAGERAGLLQAKVVDLEPVTSPSCQQPTIAWATWSASTPTAVQVS
jgi:hypothetical protein